MIFGVRKHSDPDDVENYDSRIALFGNISGILNMAAFSERACDVALDILKPLVSDSNTALFRFRKHEIISSEMRSSANLREQEIVSRDSESDQTAILRTGREPEADLGGDGP